jgi:hypothetical protein
MTWIQFFNFFITFISFQINIKKILEKILAFLISKYLFKSFGVP